jgi:hypothetical protein
MVMRKRLPAFLSRGAAVAHGGVANHTISVKMTQRNNGMDERRIDKLLSKHQELQPTS